MASQTAAILGKNLRLHWRRRFLLKDLALVAFLVVLVAIMAEERSNYITIFYLSIVIVNYSRFVVMALVEEK
jgi:fatty-acid desaturase